MKVAIYVLSALLLLINLTAGWSKVFAYELENFESVPMNIGGKTFQLEIADTPNRRQQGLMFRSELSIYTGMIFIYPQSGNHRIWMKNTRMPLAVVWIDDKATVIAIKKLRPCKQENCPSYGVRSASKYIIEFHTNFNGLKPGDHLPELLNLKVQR